MSRRRRDSVEVRLLKTMKRIAKRDTYAPVYKWLLVKDEHYHALDGSPGVLHDDWLGIFLKH